MQFTTDSSVLQPLTAACFENSPNIFIKRDDLIHPIVSGNKWRKLEFALKNAAEQNKNHIVTFGGAYSNHMVATACAGASLGLKTSCFIRGDELSQKNNHYLFTARLYGMELIPVTRENYRQKEALFAEKFGENASAYFVAEGGESEEGMLGVSKIIKELDFIPDHIVHASATGTTSMGLAKGLEENNIAENTCKIYAVGVLKNGEEQTSKFEKHGYKNRIQFTEGFDFGGYAKTTPELMQFCKDFIRQTGIMIDPVYTGKALFGLKTLLQNGLLDADKKTMFLHTGGTLGIFSDRYMNDLK